MAQVTIYLDEYTERLVKAAASSAGISRSKWVAELIRSKAANDWPASVKELAGAWPDMPLAEEIRARQPKDSRRERL